MLVEYVRLHDRTPIGTIVAVDKDHIGMSLCNPKDRFSKKIGTTIAKGRAENSHEMIEIIRGREIKYIGVPDSRRVAVYAHLSKLIKRADKYFKH